jgi:hypothetical protein
MGGNQDYDPAVRRRLELVQKQFRANVAEQNKLQVAENRRARWASLTQNRVKIGRVVILVTLGAILLAVIFSVILDKI